MLIDDLKKNASFDSTYPKAIEIVRRGRVTNLDIDYDIDSIVTVRATIQGNGGVYDARVAFDGKNESIFDYHCTCPAHDTYDGMCKHAAAATIAYLKREGEINVPSLSTWGSSQGSAYGAARYARRSYTSSSVEAFIALSARKAQEAAKATAGPGLLEEAPSTPADLIPVVTKGSPGSRYRFDESTWSLGLKVVHGKSSYVVKNIGELTSAWREGRTVSYGKKISFAHCRRAFTERANAILDIVAPIVEAQKSLHVSQLNRSYGSYSISEPPSFNNKMLPLTGPQIAQVLDLMTGAEVIYEAEDTSRRGRSTKKLALTVRDGDPDLDVMIGRDSNGDYELTVYPADIECIEGADRLFLMTETAVLRTSEEFSSKMGALCSTLLPCHDVLHIRKQDMPAFCGAALEPLQEFAKLSAPAELASVLPPKPEFVFRIGEQGSYVTCAVQVRYGTTSINLFDPVVEGQPARDVALEAAAHRTVRAYFPDGDCALPDYSLTLHNGYSDAYRRMGPPARNAAGERIPPVPCFPRRNDDAYYWLFSQGLRDLSDIGEVRLSDRLTGVRLRQAPNVSVRAHTSGGLLDIEVSSLDVTPAELLSYLASYRRKQRYVRLGNGDIMRLDGSLQALGDLADGLGVSDKDLVEGIRGLNANRTLFVDAMLKRAGGVRFDRNEGFRRIVRNFETVADADFAEPASLVDVLRPYQSEGFKWLSTLGEAGFGGILADDMGLGKTLQAIAYLLAQREGGEGDPALVVCPASLVYNWTAELARFAPGLDALPVTGTKKTREEIIAHAASHDVLVTSYDLMKRDAEAWAAQRFSCMILDEAQYIKNSSTKAAKCAKAIPADVRFALTGTPIENRLTELWSIFDFLMPGVLGSSESFGRRFSSPISAGDEGAARRLQSLVGPFILRRLKREVLTDLPDKNESVVLANMSGEQERLYRSSEAKLALALAKQLPEEFAGSKLQVLAELTKLRQICCDPNLLYENYAGDSAKLETCVELVRNAVDGGHQVLLFSQFTSMLDIIEGRLSAEKIGTLKLTGATSKEERVRLVKGFQAGEAPVFLISLKAGGVGLNLTAADIVIHYDPWWNLAAQNQATDRAHRIGQEKEVSVFKIIAKDTIEERIVQMQERKHDLAESVLGGEAAASTSITREDVLALLNAGK